MANEPRPRWTESPSGPGGDIVSLSALRTGERGEVVELAGGRGMLGRMTALGFTPGVKVTVLQNFGRGPLIALVRDTRVALGRREAGRIRVRRINCE